MALSLATMESLVWTYLGSFSGDPLYPQAVVDSLINNVCYKYQADIQQSNPSYNSATVTLASTPVGSNTYPLPADFAGWLEVRATDFQGIPMSECRLEEINIPSLAYSFAITGKDSSATLTTANAMVGGIPIYFRYQQLLPILVNPGDIPTWMPDQFHDLIPREAAIDAYGIGNEDVPADKFMEETRDRRAQFWLHIMRRGTGPYSTRPISPQ